MSEVNYLELLRTVEQGLGTEVLNRAEGDLLAQSMISKYLSDLVASNEADIQRYIEFRTKYGDDHDSLAGTMDTIRARLAETCRVIDEDLKNFIATSDERYVSMQADIKKYLTILSDITLDSTQITLDNGDIKFGAWTILSQARKWDLELLKQVNSYVDDKTQDVNDALNDFLNSVDTTEEIISKAIEELSNSPYIKELDALLNESILGLDGLKDSIYQEAVARAKEYEELARKMSEDAEKRKEEILNLVKANEEEILESTTASRDEMLERINNQATDISNLADNIANESKARADELLSMSASLSEEYTKYNLARIEDIKKLNDGLTSEATLRKQGDDASMEVINTYKVSNDSAVSAVRNSLATNVTAQEATAKKVDSLDTQYKTLNETLGTVKTTTASNTTEIKNVASANKALTERVDQILAQITDPGEGTEVTVNAFNALKAEVTTNTSSISTLAEDTRALRSDYESLNLNVSGVIDAIDTLTIEQVSTTEYVNQLAENSTVLNNSLNTVKGQLSAKVDTTLFNSLKAEVIADRDSLSSVVSDISTLQNQVAVATNDIAGKASIESVSGIESSVTTLDNKLTVVVSDLAKTNTALDSKASLETVSGMQSKIEAQGNDITLLNGQVASYNTSLNEYKEATTKSISGLTADIKKVGDDVTSYSGQLTDLSSTVSLLPNNGINLLSYDVSVLSAEVVVRVSSVTSTAVADGGYFKGTSAVKIKPTATNNTSNVIFGRGDNESTFTLAGPKLISAYVKSGNTGRQIRISCFTSPDGTNWTNNAGTWTYLDVGTDWIRVSKYITLTEPCYVAPCFYVNTTGMAVSDANYLLIANLMVESATEANMKSNALPSAWVIGTGSYSGFTESKFTTSKAYQGLVAKTEVLEQGLETQANAQTALSSELDKKATVNALNTLTTRVSTAEAGIKTHTSDMTKLQTSIDGKASTDALRLVVADVEEIDGKLSTTSQIVDSLESSYISGIIRSGYDSASSIDNLFTRYSPQATIVDESDTGTARLLTLGTDSVAASQWIRSKDLISFRPDKLYKLSARFRRVSGTGGVYLGVASMNYEETLYINTANATNSSLTASAYMYSNMKPTLGEWVELTYYIKGRSTGNASGAGTLQNPKKLTSKSAKIAPLMITNYSGIAGVTEVDYFYIEQDDHSENIEADSQAITVLQNGTKEINDVLTTQATQLTNLNSRTTALETDIKTRATITQLNEAKTTIDSSIASTTTTLTSRIDNLAIGGDNLLKTTNWQSIAEINELNKDNAMLWDASVAVASVLPFARDGGQTFGFRINAKATSASARLGFITPNISGKLAAVVAGRTYTLSFVGQGTFSQLKDCFLMYSGATANYRLPTMSFGSGGNTRRSVTFVAPTTSSSCRVMIADSRVWASTDWFSVAEVKLEEGELATAWSSNPTADIAASSAVLANAIDLVKVDVAKNADGITANSNKTTLLEIKGTGDNVTNLITDPTYADPTKWGSSANLSSAFKRYVAGSDSYAKASTNYPGSISAISITGTANAYAGEFFPQDVPITIGRKYSVSGGIRCHLTGSVGKVQLYATTLDKSKATLRMILIYELDLSKAATYNDYSGSFTAEENEVYIRYRFRFQYDSSGSFNVSHIAFPNLRLEVEPMSLTKAMSVLDSKYTDIAGVQTSQATQLTQLSANLEGSSANYIVNDEASLTGTNFITKGALVDLSVEGVGVGVGNKTTIAASTGVTYMDFVVAPKYRYNSSLNRMNVVPGRSYLIECEVMSTVARTCLIYFTRYNSSGASLSVKAPTTVQGQIYTKAMVANEWVKLSGVFLVEEGAVSAIPTLRNNSNSSTAGDTYLRNVRVAMVTTSDEANASYINTVSAKVTSAEGKISTLVDSVTVLTSKNDENTNALAIQAKVVDGIKAQYLVKMETNGVLAGFGLMQTNNTLGQIVSTFGVNANNFYIGAPANGKKPFIVTTTTTTINGVSYPAGTWIDVAFIAKASIGTAHIANASITTALIKDAAITNAKIDSITADKIEVPSSNPFPTKVSASDVTITGSSGASNLSALMDGAKGYGAAYASFGSKTSDNSESGYVQLDFKAVRTITNLRLWFYQNDARSYQYKVKYSSDGTNWKYWAGNASTWLTSPQPEAIDGKFNNSVAYCNFTQTLGISCRYLRVYANGNTVNSSNHLTEMEVSSTEMSTVIDGNGIQTNSVTADKLNVNNLSAISANLGNISVGTANIANSAITNAKIADLSVNTLKIANRAVTTSITQTQALNFTRSGKGNARGWSKTEEITATLNGFESSTIGANALLFLSTDVVANAGGFGSSNGLIYLDVYIGSTLIGTIRSSNTFGGLLFDSYQPEGGSPSSSVYGSFVAQTLQSNGTFMLPFVINSSIAVSNVIIKLSVRFAFNNPGISSAYTYSISSSTLTTYLVEFKK